MGSLEALRGRGGRSPPSPSPPLEESEDIMESLILDQSEISIHGFGDPATATYHSIDPLSASILNPVPGADFRINGEEEEEEGEEEKERERVQREGAEGRIELEGEGEERRKTRVEICILIGPLSRAPLSPSPLWGGMV